MVGTDWHHVGDGTTRIAYAAEDSNAVLKLPYDFHSMRYNQLEVAFYEQGAFYGHPVVPCRLLWLSAGIPVVLMEKIDVNDSYNFDAEMPAWCHDNDGGQCAMSPMLGGTWAAYDATFPFYQSPVYQDHGGYRGAARAEYQRLVPRSQQLFEN